MDLTHDNSLYVIEYEFEGQLIRHIIQNRCVNLDVEQLHFDLGLEALETYLQPKVKGELGLVEIAEDSKDEEEEYEESESITIDSDVDSDFTRLDDPEYLKQLEEEGKLHREKIMVPKGGFRFSHNKFVVFVVDYNKETKETNEYTIGYLPASASPMLRLWIDNEFCAWVENYSLSPDNPQLQLSVVASLFFLDDKSAKSFNFYRIKAEHTIIGGNLMEHAEAIDWKEFCAGVMDQQMEPGSEFKLMDDWFTSLDRWTYPYKLHFDKVFPMVKEHLTIDDYILHVPVENIDWQITPDDVYDSMAGCIIGFMTNRPQHESGRYWVCVPPYETHNPKNLWNYMNQQYLHLADVPAEYNSKVSGFIEGVHTTAFIHLTTILQNGLPKVVGDMYLLKCFEGHEDEIQDFAKWLYGVMNHKNDFPEKMYHLWKESNL